ncbi:glycosyltransferase family 4 protein [Jiulongibacter sediminis]|uniref:glycosyltransferase family 4 protein n=1 Tax=Jiulongibacter sediminis TaxID=1605367 RepID=UPI0026EC32A1|nr:glycosyltransferase family 4 protein [Jiulongibacter sediminis]
MRFNILFITLVQIESIYDRGIYTDLIRKLSAEGHSVFVVCPVERRYNKHNFIKVEGNVKILYVKTFNIQKTNIFEKVVSILTINYFFTTAIKNYLDETVFHLILYSTPPITITKLIQVLKHKYSAKTYLLLKDIFPQNAVDMGMFSNSGVIHNYFRKQEIKLYEISDYIGCMSKKNIEYVLKNNPYLEHSKVELNPNSIEIESRQIVRTSEIRAKYGLPLNTTIFIYGGNLGIPQGIEFLIEVLNSNKSRNDCFFLIVGSGTEYKKIESFIKKINSKNSRLLGYLPKNEFDELLSTADVGLVFLDYRFTIPNFPSRLLSYLEFKIPVLLATDVSTDIGAIAEENNFGLWAQSNDISTFNTHLNFFLENKKLRIKMGEAGFDFLKKNYSISISYEKIISKIDV